MMEINLLDVENCCRACLKVGHISIFHTYYENLALNKILNEITNVPVMFEDDGLTSKICERCRDRAIDAYNFRQQCSNSDDNLRSICDSKVQTIKEEYEQTEDFYEIHETFEETFVNEDYEEEEIEIQSSGRRKKSTHKKEQESFDCKVCEKSCISPSKLYRHLKVHKELTEDEKAAMMEGRLVTRQPSKNPRPRIYGCGYSNCDKSFESPSKLARHALTHTKAEISESDESKRRQAPRKYNTGKIHCDQCAKKFSSRTAFDRHMFTHSDVFEKSRIIRDGPQDFICVICSSTYPDHDILYNHMKDHKDAEENQHQGITCQLCLKTFFSIKNIIRHSKSHDENATHQCIHCDKKFGYGDDFIDHMMKHESSRLYQCDLCSKSFVKLHKLRQHMISHSDNAKPYLCPQCGKAFAEIDYLKRHLMRHTGIKPHKCPLCPSAFTFRGGLTTHLKTHSGLKPFVCSICGSTFTREDTLKKHIRNHAGEIQKRYSCDVCGKAFVAPFNLRTHMRIHTGEKPFACQYCDRSYSQKNDLVKHLRIHVGQNTYKCEHCESAFRLNAELKNHMLIHYRENPQLSGNMYNMEVVEEDEIIVSK